MTWEILVGLTTLLTPFLSVMGVVVKVNRSLVSLENAVKQMTATLEKQQRKNGNFSAQLSDHEKRLFRLESMQSERYMMHTRSESSDESREEVRL